VEVKPDVCPQIQIGYRAEGTEEDGSELY
jgi:hypothetical protein